MGALLIGGTVALGVIFYAINSLPNWPLTNDFDHGSSNLPEADGATFTGVYRDGGLLLTITAPNVPAASLVTFRHDHDNLAIQMDMTHRSGPVAGTFYGPACTASGHNLAFVVANNGDYRLVRSETTKLVSLADGSIPALRDSATHVLRVECESADQRISLRGYVDTQLIATAQDNGAVGPFTAGGVLAQTTDPPAQILIDNFRAENL